MGLIYFYGDAAGGWWSGNEPGESNGGGSGTGDRHDGDMLQGPVVAKHLDRNLVFDYFALSPFYDWTCNNEQLRMCSIHPLDRSHLS